MIFTESFLTNAGAALLTEAAAGSRIVWTQCGCSQVANQDTITATTTTFDNFVCKGSAVSVFTSDVASISCTMSNAEPSCTPGNADVFGLWAHLVDSEDNAGSDILAFIAKRGSAAATYFPARVDEKTELTGIVDLSVDISDGVVQTINLVQSSFALAGNLQTEIEARQALESRVVTTHSAGSPTTGDDQTIYGIKSFKSEIHVNANIYAWNVVLAAIETDAEKILWSDTDDTCIDITTYHGNNNVLRLTSDSVILLNNPTEVNGSFGITGEVYSDLIPENTGQNIGSSDKRWDNVYAEAINANSGCQFSSSVDISGNVDIGGSVDIAGGIDVVSDVKIEGSAEIDNFLDVGGDLTVTGTLNGIKFPSEISPNECSLIPRTTTMKAGGIFLAYLANTSTTYNLSVGDLIPSVILISVATAVQGTSGSTLTESYSSGTSFINDGASFRIMAEVTSFASGKAIIAPVICVKDAAQL